MVVIFNACPICGCFDIRTVSDFTGSYSECFKCGYQEVIPQAIKYWEKENTGIEDL